MNANNIKTFFLSSMTSEVIEVDILSPFYVLKKQTFSWIYFLLKIQSYQQFLGMLTLERIKYALKGHVRSNKALLAKFCLVKLFINPADLAKK